MGKYIRVEDIVSAARNNLDESTAEKVISVIEKVPVEIGHIVDHGKWLDWGDRKIVCSECGKAYGNALNGYVLFDFCPYCGADMRK